MYQRTIVKNIYERLNEERKFIQVIIGPRQVGKTTAVLQALKTTTKDSCYAVADFTAPPHSSWIATQWEIARSKLKQNGSMILVLDEVQKISQWSTEVKRLWDEDTKEQRNLSVVILGSSSLLVQKGLNESLAGRFEIIRFPHWSWTECRDAFDFTLDEYIYFGGYPGAATLIRDEPRWRNYIRDSLIETAISKDVLLLNHVAKPALLRQLFVLACEYSGQILAYQKIMGQLQDVGNTTTLAHYQKLLEAAYLIKGLEKWAGTAITRRSSSPKWIALNTALITALTTRSCADWKNDSALWGRLIETTIGAHLINCGMVSDIDIYYWRKANCEVDFVLGNNQQLVAIEVKSGKNTAAATVGLDVFKARYPHAKTLVVGSGGIQLREFLEMSLIDFF